MADNDLLASPCTFGEDAYALIRLGLSFSVEHGNFHYLGQG